MAKVAGQEGQGFDYVSSNAMASLANVLIGVSSQYPGAVVEGTIQNRRIHCDALRKHNYAHAWP